MEGQVLPFAPQTTRWSGNWPTAPLATHSPPWAPSASPTKPPTPPRAPPPSPEVTFNLCYPGQYRSDWAGWWVQSVWVCKQQFAQICGSSSRLKKYSPDSKPVLPHGRRLVRLFHIPGLACPIERFIALQRPLWPSLALNAPPADAPVPIAPKCACAPGCSPPSSARTSGPRV